MSQKCTRLRRAPAALAVAAALAACGTTVPVATQQQLAQGGGDGLSGAAPGELAGGPTTATGGGSLGSGSTTGAGPGGTSVVGGGGTGGTAPGSTAGPGTIVRPGTSTGGTVQVGITYYEDASAGLAAIGASGGTLGDQESYAEIVVNDVNARGGLGGKKVVPVYFGFDANPGAQPIPDQEEQACARFTQDNKVQIVLGETIGPTLIACLRKRGIPVVGENSFTGSGSARYAGGGVVDVGAFNVDRRAREQVKALQAQKYFTGWNTTTGAAGPAPVKVGIIGYDGTEWKDSIANHLEPAVQAAGFGKPDTVIVAPHDSYDNLAVMSNQLQSAVLQFKANGVTHVLVWDDNGVSTLFFMKAAEQQAYRPRYGVNSGNNMNLLVSTDLVDKGQVAGAVGMGWIPMQDIPDTDSGPDSTYSNPVRKTCNAVMAKGGQQGSSYNEYFANKYCGAMNAIKAAADIGGVSPSSFLAALDTLGSSVPSPATPATFLGPRQRDGMGGIYHYAYEPGADKMVYTTGVITLARS